jgi:predicted DNA-binding WGR domain protein
MDFAQVPDDFGYVVSNRTDREADERRFYMIARQTTLFDDGAVVRTFGRKGRCKRVIITPYPSLQAAWPIVRATNRTRLHHRIPLIACSNESGVGDR